MAKFAAKDSNKNITLSPHGTGKVVVGTGATDATVQSDGNHNLVLQTGNATTGSITITDGADGNIAITPNGTGETQFTTKITSTVSSGSNINLDKTTGGAITFSQSGVQTATIEDVQSQGGLRFYTGTGGSVSERLRIGSDGNLSLETNNITNVSRIELDEISARTGTSITVSLGTDSGDDFNVGSGKLLVEGDNSDVSTTGTFKGNLTAGSGKTVDVSAGTFTTSTAQKQAISATAFASGTKMLFNQTAAPTGWTKDTSSNNNSALRVVTGTAGTGGSQDFTSAFGATISVAISNASFQLLDTHLSSHSHAMRFYPQGSSHSYSFPGLPGHSGGADQNSGSTSGTGGDTAHTHSNTLSGTGSSGSTHNLSVKYVDVIIATKD